MEEYSSTQTRISTSSEQTNSRELQIAFCLPEVNWLVQMGSANITEAACIQQQYIANGLTKRGHSLTFIAPFDEHKTVYTNDLNVLTTAPQTWSDSRWFDLSSKGIWRVQQWFQVPYLNVFSNYRRYDACLQCLPGHDVVYERIGIYNNGVARACRKLDLPYVLFFDADQLAELDFMGAPITGLLRRRAENIVHYNLRTACRVICVSKSARDLLITRWDVPEEKLVIFQNSVDVDRFQPNLEREIEIRASFGVESNPLIIFVGNFYQWHDVETLLVAFAELLIDYPNIRLVLVGDGPQRQAIMTKAAEAGIDFAVHFTGLVAHAEVPFLIAAADIAVAPVPPMINELWLSPMKLFEYMASGTAVVASDIGQLAEVIQDGKNGLLVPPGDVSAMKKALETLLENPDLCNRLAVQAREDVVLNHSWDAYSASLEHLFVEIVESV